MIYNQTVFEIEETISELTDKLIQSHQIPSYIQSAQKMYGSLEVERIKDQFVTAKREFEQIEAYGVYAPEFKEKRRAVRKKKRELDTHELVREFKWNETSVQDLLDHITFDIANVVSEEIKIDAGNPFFEFAKKGCGGHCHGN